MVKDYELDDKFIAENLDIELEDNEELSLQMLNEFENGKGDEDDE